MRIVLGVSASIAAYKTIDLMRELQKRGHEMSVVLTPNACRFVSPLVMETFAPGCVYHEQFEPGQNPVLHIDLSKENDLLLVAPASANIIAKMANGIADDLLSTVYLAFRRQVIVAPAMNTHMFAHPAVVTNLEKLKTYGALIIEPESGDLACGDSGKGRFPEIDSIVEQVEALAMT